MREDRAAGPLKSNNVPKLGPQVTFSVAAGMRGRVFALMGQCM